MTVSTAARFDAALVHETLACDGRLTSEALLEWIQSDDPVLDGLIGDYPRRGGKGLRPALCLSTCRAFGGATADALGSAVALEMLHNAFLVHDDICDDATLRRGAPAMHVEHGVPRALLAGDALAWSALGPLLANAEVLGGRLALELLEEFDHLTRQTIDGQASELTWREHLAELDIDSYLSVALHKTCWYSAIQPCRIGALIGTRGTADLEAVSRYGYFVGALFQIVDDLDDVTAGRDGQAAGGGDLVEGKPTLMLAHLLATADQAVCDEALGLVGAPHEPAGRRPDGADPPDEAGRVARVIDLFELNGSIDYVREFADGLAGAALIEHERAFGHLAPSADTTFLRSLVLHLRE